jgi:hypothetical protein
MSENNPEVSVRARITTDAASRRQAGEEDLFLNVIDSNYEDPETHAPKFARVRRYVNIILQRMGESDGQT